MHSFLTKLLYPQLWTWDLQILHMCRKYQYGGMSITVFQSFTPLKFYNHFFQHFC